MVGCPFSILNCVVSTIISNQQHRYGLNAVLDDTLTQYMALGKIYPGLKLRVVGAKVSLLNSFLFIPFFNISVISLLSHWLDIAYWQ